IKCLIKMTKFMSVIQPEGCATPMQPVGPSLINSRKTNIGGTVFANAFTADSTVTQGRLSLSPGGADAPPPKLGGKAFWVFGGRTKNIDVLMIVMLKLANDFSDYKQVPRCEDRSHLKLRKRNGNVYSRRNARVGRASSWSRGRVIRKHFKIVSETQLATHVY